MSVPEDSIRGLPNGGGWPSFYDLRCLLVLGRVGQSIAAASLPEV